MQFWSIEGNIGTNLDGLRDLDANARFGTIQHLSGRETRLAKSPFPLQFNERI